MTSFEKIMARKYIKPRVEILDCNIKNIICGSYEDMERYRERVKSEIKNDRENDYKCGCDCKFWYFCLDRERYRHCSDKELK